MLFAVYKKTNGIYIYVFHQSHHLEHLLVTSAFLLLKVIILGNSFRGTRGTSFFGGASSVLECLFLQSPPFSEMPRRWIVGLFGSGFFHDTCIECICIHIVTCKHARQCIRCNEKSHECVCDAYVHTYVYNVQIKIHILYRWCILVLNPKWAIQWRVLDMDGHGGSQTNMWYPQRIIGCVDTQWNLQLNLIYHSFLVVTRRPPLSFWITPHPKNIKIIKDCLHVLTQRSTKSLCLESCLNTGKLSSGKPVKVLVGFPSWKSLYTVDTAGYLPT